ncbi:CrcB family protein [Streptomyces caniscabiei]|uniref:fluoride efflux transporter FluC n=1 Tax=Streptomyces caniscabiei TaxID=2746961 RepID=UPI0029B83208|nr:CrcB family protein [Streptomyces caniscabiei]MDX2600177.1 CrcB family protein [Streptomyces caniscabiei]MDX2741550.1 CrcB family protein [Streptomyces caniscabiei]
MPPPHPDRPASRPSTGEPEIPESPDAPVADPPRAAPWHGQAPVVAVVAAGGGIGAGARYGAGLLWPVGAGGFPWTTFWVNVVGCFLIGLLMVAVTEVWTAHRLVRPFLGTGVLGGFTTFSTYAVDIQRLIEEGRPATALAYLAVTLLAALLAVGLATATARHVLGAGPAPRSAKGDQTPQKGKRSS